MTLFSTPRTTLAAAVAAPLLAVATAVSLGAAAPAASAHAEPPAPAPAAPAAPAPEHAQHVVVYGDSYAANPNQLATILDPNPLFHEFTKDYPRQGKLASGKTCYQAPDSWPYLLKDRGLDIRDWSCTAQTSRTMLERIDASVTAGDLTPQTDTVVFPVGINNFGPWGAKDDVNVLNPQEVREKYLRTCRRRRGACARCPRTCGSSSPGCRRSPTARGTAP
ncbi:hypothetical protein MTQ22_10590 [Corynebacterium bovis]|uniref:hypothetical protein n=1 Tax=Corynebacterium bovis TaxID=36808 RepID=UPI003138CE05